MESKPRIKNRFSVTLKRRRSAVTSTEAIHLGGGGLPTSSPRAKRCPSCVLFVSQRFRRHPSKPASPAGARLMAGFLPPPRELPPRGRHQQQETTPNVAIAVNRPRRFAERRGNGARLSTVM